ncbi:MAG: PAS domain S-box protein [Candidatus Zixiibacteriota bacterium]|nr:MAG: PAS domain S-box protein [candidate division Zixibacteria bacterium]
MTFWRYAASERTLYSVLAVTACAIIGAMLFILHSGTQMIGRIGPLADATMEIGMEATQAHLWLMEAVTEEDLAGLDTAQAYLDIADQYALAMLEGGTVGDITYAPLTHPRMREQVEEVRHTIRGLQRIGHQEMQTIRDLLIDPDQTHSHDLLFTDLLDQTAAVERQLRLVINNELSYFRHVQITLIFVCIGFFALVAGVIYRYLTEQKRSQARINHLNQVLRAIRNVTHLITRERDRSELIKKTCESLVTNRGFHNAWITLTDESGRPIAWAESGLDDSFESAQRILEKGELIPCCEWVKDRDELVIIKDPPAECAGCPLAKMYTGRSGLATALKHDNSLYGYMVVSTPRAYAYDPEEQSLFSELAQDIALSLHLIAVEEKRSAAEKALRSSEERYRTLAANIPESDIYLFDHDLRFIVADGAEMKKNNLSPEFYEGRTLFETWEEPAAKVMEPLFRRALDGESATDEFDCCCNTYLILTVPIFNERNEVVAGMGLTHNITDRKRAEEALRLTQFSVDHAADAVFWIDSQFRFIRVNDTACQLLGYSAEELCTMKLCDITPDNTPEVCRKQWDEAKKRGSLTLETRQQTKDGRFIPVEVNVSYMAFKGQEYECGFVRDITERKRAEEALRESEEKFRMLSEQALMGIAIVQSDIVKYANSAAREIFEVDPVHYPFIDMREIAPKIHPEDAQHVLTQLAKKQNGDPDVEQHYDFRVVTGSARVRWIEVYSRTISYEGQPADFVTLIDITARKRGELLQAALLQISEATNVSSDISDLLKAVHKSLGTLIDTTNFYVALYDSSTGAYSFPYCVDQYEGTDFSSQELKESLTDYVRRTGEPILVNKEVQSELERQGEVTTVGRPSPVWLGVPLKAAGGVLGVVVVQSYTDADLYDLNDLELLSFVSSYITIAVERKLAEEAVRASEERLRTIFEAARSVSFILTDVDGTESRILEFSPGAEHIFGYSRDEVIGRPVSMLHLPEDTARFPAVIEAMRHGQEGFSGERTLVRKSGEQFPALFMTSPLFDSNGIMNGTVGVSIDITDRVQAVKALQESEERFRAIYEQAAVGVALLSPDGRWLRGNQKFCDILGYTNKELRRLTFNDVTHPDDLGISPPQMERMLSNEISTYSVEKRYIKKDGPFVWVNVTGAMARGPEGEPRYVIAVVEDITERKTAEEMVARYTDQLLKANQELEAKQAELEEFIYTVSHDLKSPVVSISGFAGLIRERLSDKLDDKTSNYLERVRVNTEVMEDLIGDLLELSRIGRMDEAEETVDTESLVDEVFESLSVAAMEKNIDLHRAAPMPAVTGWPQRIRQLLTNLVDNAIKYMPDHRPGAEVSVGFDRSKLNPAGGHGAFYVKDNGAGIPKQFHHRIFAMFQRVGNVNGEANGSGVGLTIAKRIVEKHGCHIWVESDAGSGASFHFTLPLPEKDVHRGASHKKLQPEQNMPGR